jgi:membrane protein DedA with SNARE-associated domain
MGQFSTIWVAIAAGAGAALGETSGFLAGYSGQGFERTRYGAQVEGWMKKYGPLTIFFLSFIPTII